MPNAITAGLIPATNKVGKASVKIVREGAKLIIEIIVTANDTKSVCTTAESDDVYRSAVEEIKLTNPARAE